MQDHADDVERLNASVAEWLVCAVEKHRNVYGMNFQQRVLQCGVDGVEKEMVIAVALYERSAEKM